MSEWELYPNISQAQEGLPSRWEEWMRTVCVSGERQAAGAQGKGMCLSVSVDSRLEGSSQVDLSDGCSIREGSL